MLRIDANTIVTFMAYKYPLVWKFAMMNEPGCDMSPNPISVEF